MKHLVKQKFMIIRVTLTKYIQLLIKDDDCRLLSEDRKFLKKVAYTHQAN